MFFLVPHCSSKLNPVPSFHSFVLQFCLFCCFCLKLSVPPHSQPHLPFCSSKSKSYLFSSLQSPLHGFSPTTCPLPTLPIPNLPVPLTCILCLSFIPISYSIILHLLTVHPPNTSSCHLSPSPISPCSSQLVTASANTSSCQPFPSHLSFPPCPSHLYPLSLPHSNLLFHHLSPPGSLLFQLSL